MKKVKILKSLAGAYKMSYVAGDEIEVNEALANDLIENKFAIAIEVESTSVETKEQKTTPEKAVKKSK
jgi:uncharacterized protein YukJ